MLRCIIAVGVIQGSPTTMAAPLPSSATAPGAAISWPVVSAGSVHLRRNPKLIPQQVNALLQSGTIAGRAGNYLLALECFERALAIAPAEAVLHNNRALALKGLNRIEDALASLDRAVAIDPTYAQAHANRGNLLHSLGQFAAALESYDRAVAARADYAECHYNRAILLGDLKQWNDALAGFDRAIAIRGDYAEAYNNRGVVLKELGQREAALASFDKAILLKPDLAEAHSNRGDVQRELGLLNEALASCRYAVAIKSDLDEAHENLGAVLADLGRTAEALQCYNRAIELKPERATSHFNLGNALFSLQQYESAIASYSEAVARRPDYGAAHEGCGNALFATKQYEAAVVSYDRAISLNGTAGFLVGLRRHVQMQICDWGDLDQDLALIESKIEHGEAVTPPFALLSLIDSPSLQSRAAQIWVREQENRPAIGMIGKYDRNERIRIAYFSSDFYNHATLYLMAGLFERHDRSRFAVTAITTRACVRDEMRTRLEAACERVIDVTDLSDREVAESARSSGIDIAIDLKGYTSDSRPGIFASRAAPIQVSYLGYPGTLGADYIDYLIADAVIIPRGNQRYYCEKIVYLPNSYQVNDRSRRISERQYTRAQLGLPESGFVFCCFNNTYKILPFVFSCWMRVLQRVPDSVLWLLDDNATATMHLRNEAERRGVSASRLVFAPRIPPPEHLARHRTADLFLDTLPCNAHTTASDALWAGLPVLTCQGKAFAARVAASLLRAIGLPELITDTMDQYVELAIEMATNPVRLAETKDRLRANRLIMPLFDTRASTSRLEAAYEKIYDRYHAGLPPEELWIDDA